MRYSFSTMGDSLAADGARLVEGWIDAAAEAELVGAIEAAPWRDHLKRRTQHYGWCYDYKARRVDSSMRLGACLIWASALTRRIADSGLGLPDQVIVNEYLPGQGIASHVDCIPCLGLRSSR